MNIYSNFISILTDNQIMYFSEGGAGAGGDVGGNSVVIGIGGLIYEQLDQG